MRFLSSASPPRPSSKSVAGSGRAKSKAAAEKSKTSQSISRAGGGYVGKISIPMDGGKYYIEFMLRENDLTEELKNLRTEKMKEILGQSTKPEPKPTERQK